MDNLPAHLTSFIGRTSTIELVVRQLAEHRLLSLVGPGGCGKTRLAIKVARQATGGTPNGQPTLAIACDQSSGTDLSGPHR